MKLRILLSVFLAVASARGANSDADIKDLVAGLKDKNDKVRSEAARGLSRSAEGRAALLTALKSEDKSLRAEAARGLSSGDCRKHPDRIVPALTEALADSEPLVRRRAADSLYWFERDA